MTVTSLLFAASLLTHRAAAKLVRSPTPPMGWNSYNTWNCLPDEEKIHESARGLVDLGFQSVGYNFVTVDCGWNSKDRDSNGRLQWNTTLFPSGGKALGDFLHDLGLDFGLYSGAGYLQCGSEALPASLGFEQLDAESFAEWGGDSLKYDNCYSTSNTTMVDSSSAEAQSPARFQHMAAELDAINRDIQYYVCQWGIGTNVGEWAADIGTTWRMSNDIYNAWRSIWRITNQIVPYFRHTTTGAFADMDMLIVGLRALSEEEERFHFGMWAINKSPLIMGAALDPKRLSQSSIDIMTNKEVIAIDQDPLAKPAKLIQRNTESEWDIWLGELSGSRQVLGVANWRNDSQTVEVNLASLGIASAIARDVWAAKDLGVVSGSQTLDLAGHELRLWVLSDVEAAAPLRSGAYHSAADASFSGPAQVVSCAEGACLPTGSKVGYIDRSAGVTFSNVSVASAGKKLLSVDFVNYDYAFTTAWDWGDNARNMTVAVNGKKAKRWAFPLSGGNWEESLGLNIEVDGFTEGGANTVEFRGYGDSLNRDFCCRTLHNGNWWCHCGSKATDNPSSVINTKLVPHTSTPLTTGWSVKQGDRSSTSPFLPAHDAPTEIYRDLVKNGKIKDPFIDLNELSVRWVGDETWTYSTTFDAPQHYGKAGVTSKLQFEGLDTFASVYLNGVLILESDNMFEMHWIDTTGKLKDRDNALEIIFHSARKRGLELVKEHKEHRYIVHQTEISRGPVRKAQYHWGWDWGPILMTCGIWRPISLQTWTSELSNLDIHYDLSHELDSATIKVTVDWEGPVDSLTFTVTKKGSSVIEWSGTISLRSRDRCETASASGIMKNIELWWPRGYGNQNMYTIQAEAYAQSDTSESQRLHSTSKDFGFRRAELIQEPDQDGQSFYFRINNVDVFCGGSCWIPADSFLTRVTPSDYHAWVKLAADGNQTMIRIWGGGIYEAHALYNAADELGVLVWQDFMFACANYPAHTEYLESVETEARQNVQQVRRHPSIICWTGNNEDYQIVERYGLEYDPDNRDPESWLRTNFPARYIYEYLLPKIVSQESPSTPYHPSSPFGNGRSTVLKVDPTIGDIHQWNVWHGTMEPYQRLPELGGRFVSEFGMEAYPHISTIEKWVTRPEDRYPGSIAMDFRNKAIGHERRLISYVAENFRVRYDLKGFAHLTQVMQADAMSWAYKSWRRDWGSCGSRKCGGVLVWQLNDCWPTMSWAVIDYERVPKPAYYAIKRAMQPLAIGVQRKVKSWTMRPADEVWQRDTGHVDMSKLWRDVEYDVWVANGTVKEAEGSVRIRYVSIKTGAKIGQELKRDVRIAANGTTEIINIHMVHVDISKHPDDFDFTATDPFVIEATLHIDGQYVATDVSWPEPIKYLSFEDRGIKVEYNEDLSVAFVSASKPVKGFVFSERKGVRLSDNGFDVIPGETHEVQVDGIAANELEWSYVEI
ncbi:carbohydrate-binding module family 35 protein [Bipolaris oryzae ATCC 44560]|uniref:Alpha-galactosidase n=1 Tax=Bipolaris oryzae ATCC 44560 TaxID=930090 RepID=W6Z849_COCMI|nr:carbohydrate-binding module family 35 protein [Bipolaris oryzae ATCC 44560]EUC45953.1 carbohydrate-binding module family 35 protein [Bipolaris oryzae ATCC 44560]